MSDHPTPPGAPDAPRTVAGHYQGREIQIPVPPEAVLRPVSELHFHPRNPRQGDVGAVVESIVSNGFFTALTVQRETNQVLAGNHRLKAALQLGMAEVPVLTVSPEDEAAALRVLLADNRTSDLATYDTLELASILQELAEIDPTLEGTGYDGEALDELLESLSGDGDGEGDAGGEKGPGDQNPTAAGSLQGRFLIPPFSVLDTRQGYWRDRKRKWLALGLQSELGRDVETFAPSAQSPAIYNLRNAMRAERGADPSWEEIIAEAERRGMHVHAGVSIFDPVLTELIYLWFAPPGGTVLDPFAGGSVRGVVAAALGLEYVGVELRGEQVEANRAQWATLEPRLAPIARDEDAEAQGAPASTAVPTPAWVHGDSAEIPALLPDLSADVVMSCPPYADLEVYSDDPRDISNMDYADFLRVYRLIIQNAVQKLKDNRFAVFVVNDVRDKRGFYRNFLRDTIDAFEAAGMHFYNEIVLVNNIGSAAIRAGKQFEASRKVARVHQNVLVFYKGDPKTIRENYPELNISDLESYADPDADDAPPEDGGEPGESEE